MSAPDRPLSLSRLKDLPIGAVLTDRNGNLWLRIADPRHPGYPGWFQNAQGKVASATTLHAEYRPLRHRAVRAVRP